MSVQPPGPEFRLFRTGRQARYPPLTAKTYYRLLDYGLRASRERGERAACTVAWVPSLVVGELVDALDAEGYVCWCWPHDAETGMSRLRVTRATPEEEAGCVP